MKKYLVFACFLAVLMPALAHASVLSLSPASRTVAVGDTFTVNINLDTEGKSIVGADAMLTYDMDRLQVVNVGSSSDVQIAPGSLMTTTTYNKVDSQAGRIYFSQVTFSSYSGSGTLATITFRAVAGGTANVNFIFTPGNTTDSNVAVNGVDTLSSVQNGVYTIGAAGAVESQNCAPNPTYAMRGVQCQVFPSQCDVPSDWTVVVNCPQPDAGPIAGISDRTAFMIEVGIAVIVLIAMALVGVSRRNKRRAAQRSPEEIISRGQ